MPQYNAKNRSRIAALIAGCGLVALTVPAAPASAQISEYIVHSGDQGTFSVLQQGQLIRSWGVAAGTDKYQYPLAVNTTVRAMGADDNDIGAEYDLNGNDLGTRYINPAFQSRCWDGTTDGTSNYTIDTGGKVARYDANWSSPTILFSAGSIGSITYDPTNDSFWIGQFSTTVVTEYDMHGAVLRSFDTGHTKNMALALDHADGTLWLHDRNEQGTFEQWTKDGVLLTRRVIAGMNGQNALGGEFAFTETSCYADCDTSTGVGVLDIFDFLCFQDSFVAGNTYACDCDTTTGLGVCDIFDFLCFQDAFVAGCP